MLGTSLLCLRFAGAATRAWQFCGSVTWQQEGHDLLQGTTPGFPRGPVYVSIKPVSPNRSLGPQILPQDPTSYPTCFCGASTLGSLPCLFTHSVTLVHTHLRLLQPSDHHLPLTDGYPPPPLALAWETEGCWPHGCAVLVCWLLNYWLI